MFKLTCSTVVQQFERNILSRNSPIRTQIAGLKFYYPPQPVDSSEWPENRKLRPMDKQPNFISKPPKMFKMIKLMRGPEAVHNELIYKGYGVKALLGGRLTFKHFETIRNIVNKKLEARMFAVWRVDAPWQPLAKRSTGKRLGGGKGAIRHYCTPVRADRIIVEIGGDLHELEAKKILVPLTSILPFPARFVSQKDLEKEKEHEKWVDDNNINPYTMEYIIKNNMGGCQKYISPYDYKWYGKYK